MTETPAPSASPAAPAAPTGERTFSPSSSGSGNGQGLSALGSLFSAAANGLPPGIPAAPEPAKPAEAPAPAPTPAPENPPAPPAPAPEVKVESPKAKDFKLIKEQREAAVKQADAATKQADAERKEKQALAAKIAEYEEKLKTAVPADYEQLKSKTQELQNRMERIAVEKSDRFIEQYDKPLVDTFERVKADVAGIEGFDMEELTELVKNPNAKNRLDRLNDLISTLPPLQQSRINARITKYEELSEARAAALENHKGVLEAERRASEEQVKVREAGYAKVMDEVLGIASENMPYLMTIEGNDAHNQQVEEIKADIRKAWLEPSSSEALAQIVVAGKVAPIVYNHATTLYHENQRLAKELAELKGATAKVQAGTSGSPAPAPTSISALFKQGAGFQSE